MMERSLSPPDPALRKAVEAALSGDHVSACHMLPALIESSLRQVLASRGVDVNAYTPRNGGRMQERTMGSFFGTEADAPLATEAKRVLGEDLWKWYRAVLFDEESFGLRHRAAHGLLRDDECTAENAETLLLGLVALLRAPEPLGAQANPREDSPGSETDQTGQ